MLFQKLDISRSLQQVREGICYIINQSQKFGWNKEREDKFIELNKREDDLISQLLA